MAFVHFGHERHGSRGRSECTWRLLGVEGIRDRPAGFRLVTVRCTGRSDETLLMKVVNEFHPDFFAQGVMANPGAGVRTGHARGQRCQMPGNGMMRIEMSERSSLQGIRQVAARLFRQGAAEQRIVVSGQPPVERVWDSEIFA